MADIGTVDMILPIEDRPGESEQIANDDPKDDDATPPDGGYGWVCVACILLINCHTWGIIGVSTSSMHHLWTYLILLCFQVVLRLSGLLSFAQCLPQH
jgi:hypothetical protein